MKSDRVGSNRGFGPSHYGIKDNISLNSPLRFYKNVNVESDIPSDLIEETLPTNLSRPLMMHKNMLAINPFSNNADQFKQRNYS